MRLVWEIWPAKVFYTGFNRQRGAEGREQARKMKKDRVHSQNEPVIFLWASNNELKETFYCLTGALLLVLEIC